jgi:peptide/nickel transport system substrate-binding protein
MNRVNIIKFRLYSTEMLSRKIKTIVSACAGIQTFSTLQRIPGIVLSMLGFSRSRRWFRKFIGLFAIACFLVVSCGQPQTPTVTTDPDRVIIGTTEKIRTLDPADAYEVASGTFLYNMGDRLYTYKLGTTEIIPQLATELPNISEDGKTYTIPIREGVTFHDGTPFNAEAMTFSLRRFAENGGSPSSLLSGVVESIQATAKMN